MRQITLIVGADYVQACRKSRDEGLARPNAPGSDVVWTIDASRIQSLLPAHIIVLEPCSRRLRQLAMYRLARAKAEP